MVGSNSCLGTALPGSGGSWRGKSGKCRWMQLDWGNPWKGEEIPAFLNEEKSARTESAADEKSLYITLLPSIRIFSGSDFYFVGPSMGYSLFRKGGRHDRRKERKSKRDFYLVVPSLRKQLD